MDWISVDEYLPGEGRMVLIAYKWMGSKNCRMGYYWLGGEKPKFVDFWGEEIRYVTHWAFIDLPK